LLQIEPKGGFDPMKLRIASLTLLCLALGVIPVSAQVLYDNGPINGTTDAWTINFGYVVSDSFTLTSDATITSLEFGMWILPGDILNSVEVSVTSQENSGKVFFDQVLKTTQSGCAANQYGYDVCIGGTVIVVWPIAAGTYWLNLQNAVVNNGDPVFFDENSGVGCKSSGCPSQASESAVGTIPSESFTINGTGTSGSTPEPSSILLFGSGLLGLAGVLRRRLF
jgi:PEP-CTERM motif